MPPAASLDFDEDPMPNGHFSGTTEASEIMPHKPATPAAKPKKAAAPGAPTKPKSSTAAATNGMHPQNLAVLPEMMGATTPAAAPRAPVAHAAPTGEDDEEVLGSDDDEDEDEDEDEGDDNSHVEGVVEDDESYVTPVKLPKNKTSKAVLPAPLVPASSSSSLSADAVAKAVANAKAKMAASNSKPPAVAAAPEAASEAATADAAKQARPRTAFIIFSGENRSRVMKNNPGIQLGGAQKVIGEMWKKLSDSERKRYDDLALAEKERYISEHGPLPPKARSSSSSAAAAAAAAVANGSDEESQEKSVTNKRPRSVPSSRAAPVMAVVANPASASSPDVVLVRGRSLLKDVLSVAKGISMSTNASVNRSDLERLFGHLSPEVQADPAMLRLLGQIALRLDVDEHEDVWEAMAKKARHF